MKQHITHIVGIIIAALSITGCIKREIFNTLHPTMGAVEINGYYALKSQEAELESPYMIHIDTSSFKNDGLFYKHKKLLHPGPYNIIMYNIPNGMELRDSIIYISQTSENEIIPEPGYFFHGKALAELHSDDTLKFPMPLVQQTRRLDFRFELTGGSIEKIDTIYGQLNGLYGAFDCINGDFHGKPEYNSTAGFEFRNDSLFTKFHLIGISQDSTIHKTLKITIKFTDGYKQSIETPIDTYLKDFNNNINKKVLNGKFDVHTGTDFNFTITDWKDNESSSDANM